MRYKSWKLADFAAEAVSGRSTQLWFHEPWFYGGGVLESTRITSRSPEKRNTPRGHD